jgi:hypothetical protein
MNALFQVPKPVSKKPKKQGLSRYCSGLTVEKGNDFFDRPNAVRDASFHRWSNAQGQSRTTPSLPSIKNVQRGVWNAGYRYFLPESRLALNLFHCVTTGGGGYRG